MLIAVIPLLAIRKTDMFTPLSFACLGPHALLNPLPLPTLHYILEEPTPRDVIICERVCRMGNCRFAHYSLRSFSGNTTSAGRNTTSVCFDLLLGLSLVIHASGLFTLWGSHINLGN